MDAPVKPRLSQAEFIALVAMLFATIAFMIDAMLPALPEIAAELTPDNPNRAAMIVTSFMLGMGIGTLFAGPFSDRFGRKPVILASSGLYCVASLIAWAGGSLEVVLAARVLQGIGASGPRIVTIAMLRDLYSGREMARIMSFAMMVFTIVPALAPAMGALIISVSDWRGIFLAFVAFGLISSLWLWLRQPETLPAEARRPLRLAPLRDAAREVMTHRVVMVSIMIQTLIFAGLILTLTGIQPVFEQTFDSGDSFPLWFAVIALVSGTASLVNALLVVRLGMRRIVRGMLILQLVMSAVMAGVTYTGFWPAVAYFPAFMVWATGVFFMAGLTLGNMNSIALEPMGHIAGMATSVIVALYTVLAVMLAVPLGMITDGTPGPLALSVGVLVLGALALMRRLPR